MDPSASKSSKVCQSTPIQLLFHPHTNLLSTFAVPAITASRMGHIGSGLPTLLPR